MFENRSHRHSKSLKPQKTTRQTYPKKQVCSNFYRLKADEDERCRFVSDKTSPKQLIQPSRPKWRQHFQSLELQCERQPLKYFQSCYPLSRNAFILVPMLSRNVGSSETRSSFPRKPRIVLKAGSLTLFSGSAVKGHKAGNMRFATSLSRKYCWVAARANMPATPVDEIIEESDSKYWRETYDLAETDHAWRE